MTPEKHEFTNGQEALIERVAFRAAEVIEARLREVVTMQIDLHAASCPAARLIEEGPKYGSALWGIVKSVGAGIAGAVAAILSLKATTGD